MKVVITRSTAGPEGTFDRGKVYDLPADIAHGLIAGFAAEPLEEVQREAALSKQAARVTGQPHMARVETR